jgi:hypothetical protein
MQQIGGFTFNINNPSFDIPYNGIIKWYKSDKNIVTTTKDKKLLYKAYDRVLLYYPIRCQGFSASVMCN